MKKGVVAVCSAIALVLLGSCAADVADPSESAELVEVSSALTACPAGSIVDPPQFQWTYHPASGGNSEPYYSGTMEVGEADFTIGGESLTTRAYRQKGTAYTIPGPTMNMVPGNKYVLHFENTLPYEVPSSEHNVFKDPNISNIHTHGLHISGESPGDDVTRYFEGGYGGDFVYDIPADHMGGTYWYHAHHHGSTFLQVSGGMFGQLIIDDGQDGLPANVANMTERQVILGFLDPAAAGTGGDTLISGTLGATWTVNGQVSGSMCMPQNEWQHWRVLLADRNSMEKTVGVGANCEVALMARDGVWRTTAPKMLTSNSISLTGASRADLAVRCSDDSTITINGNAVATVAVNGAGDATVHPFAEDGTSMWSATRPAYLRDLRGETNVNTESVRMGARTVNGSKFDHMNPTFRLNADKVQQWGINGAAMHPFHLHVYHMQSMNCGGDFEDGEYYDVVASNCNVRFDLNAATSTPYNGRTIMHCHILAHEDQGAMGWLDVVGGQGAPTFPADTCAVFDDYSAIGGSTGPVCGDTSCDVSEDTCTCATDCGQPPLAETSCADGLDDDCDSSIDCDDADCSADAACQTSSCGDATCDVGEDVCSCSADCGAPAATELSCTGGFDDDCDGAVDCDDSDCSADAACQVACDGDGICEAGEDCDNCASDCDGVSSGRPSNRYCCGDGTLAGAEGDGSICDGNP